MDIARHKARNVVELLAGDDLAECPDCHDYAHPSSTVCESCGARLYPKNSNDPGRSSLHGLSASGVERRTIPMVKDCTCGDAGICSRCVMAEYDGETAHINQAHDTLEAAIARPDNVTPLHPGWGYSKRVG